MVSAVNCTACLAISVALLSAQSVQAQRWPDEAKQGPFRYHADFSLQPIYPLLSSVSSLQNKVPAILRLPRVDETIHIFLFEKTETYKNYLGQHFPGVPNRPALFIKKRGPGMVFTHLGPKVAIDLRHETTHAVLHAILPMVPLWLDEGLAEYFEVPEHDRASGHPHFASVKRDARWGRVPSMASLEKIGELSKMKSKHYRDSWAWTHFMLHGPPEAKVQLTSFLNDISAQIPPGELSDRLRRNVPNLRESYLNHFRSWQQNKR